MANLTLVRHGQSTWNLEGRFTGWIDVDLTNQGEEEALAAGKALAELGIKYDIALTSVLKRATRTLEIALYEMDLAWIPVEKNWRLNERHYGALQGLNKEETAEQHGAEQVKLWRRSYDVPPPSLDPQDATHPRHDPRYKLVAPELLPGTECLADVLQRMLPYYFDTVVPLLLGGQNVIISAHGNSLRALVKHLETISDHDIVNYEIPNGEPIVYELDEKLVVSSKTLLRTDIPTT